MNMEKSYEKLAQEFNKLNIKYEELRKDVDNIVRTDAILLRKTDSNEKTGIHQDKKITNLSKVISEIRDAIVKMSSTEVINGEDGGQSSSEKSVDEDTVKRMILKYMPYPKIGVYIDNHLLDRFGMKPDKTDGVIEVKKRGSTKQTMKWLVVILFIVSLGFGALKIYDRFKIKEYNIPINTELVNIKSGKSFILQKSKTFSGVVKEDDGWIWFYTTYKNNDYKAKIKKVEKE